MKNLLQISKHFFAIVLLLSVMSLFGSTIDKNTAERVGANFLKSKNVIFNELKCTYTFETTVNKTTTACYYLFNADNQAFVLVAADDCVRPILGYSTQNALDVDQMPSNMTQFLGDYITMTAEMISRNAQATASVEQQWMALKSGNVLPTRQVHAVEPMLSSTWDQDNPYNAACPEDASSYAGGRVYAGCVATAMAQVINYWEYPSVGFGYHAYEHAVYGEQVADFENTTYFYNMMPDAITEGSPEAQIAAVATLIYHCAVSVDMDFGPDGSGAYTEDAAASLREYFGYPATTRHYYRNSYNTEEWIYMMQTELLAGRPMIYHGQSASEGGHAFVCDGCDDDSFFHFNWGWSGYGNGYFSIDDMNSGNGTFNLDQGAIMGIQGEVASNCEAPSNLQVSVAADNTLNYTWTAPESVEFPRYKIYIGSLVKYADDPHFSINLPMIGEVCAKVATICDEIGEESDPTEETCVTLYHVDIEEVAASNYQVYPNPAHREIIVDGAAIEHVMVYNLMGQLIEKHAAENVQQLIINTENYTEGIYLLKITNHSGSTVSQRVIVKH